MDASLPDQAGIAIPPLVGRDREQALLQHHLALLQAGRGSLLLISGEAGIGKTTLVEGLARAAPAAGVTVSIGHCFDLTTPPYGPWIDLFNQLDGADRRRALSPILRDPQRLRHLDTQVELFAQIRDALIATATRRPLVLILEDLHWADLASLDLLRFVARQVTSHALVILVTYRVDELTRRHPLFRFLPTFVRECQAVRVDLKRLSLEMVRDFVRMRYRLTSDEEGRLAGYLYQHSEGNPLYFTELLRALVEDTTLAPATDGWRLGDLTELPIPPLVLQIIETRLGRLSERATHLLTVAAVIGQQVPLAVWSSVSQAGDEELADVIEQADEAHLLVEVPGRSHLRFTHALIREALYSGMVLPRRHAWHRRVAETLASQREPDPEPIAFHFQQAGDPRAAEWLIQAGGNALLGYAPQAAIDRFTAALSLPDVLERSQQLACYRARGLAYETSGELARAQADLEAALELARDIQDQDAEWQTLLNLGMLWAARDYARTEAYYQQALNLARAINDPTAVARSLNRLGNWQVNSDQPADARRNHEAALATFRDLTDRRGIAETLDLLGVTMSLSGDLWQLAAYYDEAIALFRELDDRQGLSSALASASERGGTLAPGSLIPAATLIRSQRDAEAAIEIARDIGWRSGEIYALSEAGITLSARGEFGRALVALLAAERIAGEIEHRQWLSIAYGFLGALHNGVLATEPAREYCERGIAFGREVRSVVLERLVTVYLILALIEDGELAEAASRLDTMFDPVTTQPVCFTEIFARLARAELELAQYRPDATLRTVEQLLVRIPNAAPERVPIWPAILRGQARTLLRRWDEAEADLRAAIRDATYQGAIPLLVRAQLALGALYGTQARVAAAEQQFSQARTLVEQLAATIPDGTLRATYLHRMEDRLATLQPAAPSASLPRRSALSSREIEVLRLVSEGLTDADVAVRLSISRRTVTSHLTSIYNKLGVSTRTAAAHVAASRDLI